MKDIYLRFADAIDKVARLIVIVLMAVMCVIVLVGVFFRYILGDALDWTEEASRYLMIWMGFLGTGLALREGGHVAIDTFLNRLPATARRAAIVVVRLLAIGFLAVVVGAGCLLIPRIGNQVTAVLGISAAWPYLAIPVGCALTIIEMVALMIRDPDQKTTYDETELSLEIRS